MDLITLARRSGLDPQLIANQSWPEPAKPDAALASAPPKGPLEALDYARRRGLDEHAVSALWPVFERRPVELGLFAWDVLANSLIADHALLDKLHQAALAVREVLPAPVERFARTLKVSAGALVDRLALPAFQDLGDAEMDQAIQFHALGSLEVNQILARRQKATFNTVALQMAHQFARYLGLSGMTTLASFYLDYLWDRCEYRPALDDLVETCLDAGCINLPWKDELLAANELELLEYATGRSWIELDLNEKYDDDVRARGQLDYHGKAAEVAKTHQRLHLVRAHSFLAEEEHPVPVEVIVEIVKANPAWRYAGRVRVAILAQLTPAKSDLPLKAFDSFLGAFGNERGAWNDLNVYGPSDAVWREPLYARAVREATTLPHDPAAWRSLGINLGTDDQTNWDKVVRARLESQCKLD